MNKVLSVPAALIMSSLLVGQSATAEDKRVVDRPTLQADGSVRLPARTIEMPGSFSPEARKAFLDYYARGGDPALTGDIQNIRRVYDQQWAGPILARWEKRFPVRTEHKSIAGVPVDIVTPAAGVAADKRDKVLRSEERRVGKGCVDTGRAGWW